MCFRLFCLLCARGTPLSLRRLNPTWVDVAKVSLYCLHFENPDAKYFSLKQNFYPFLIEHAELLHLHLEDSGAKRKWHKCVQDALCHHRHVFQRAVSRRGKGWWGLIEMSDPWNPVEDHPLNTDRPSKRIKVTTSPEGSPPQSPSLSPPDSPASSASSPPQSPPSLASSSEISQPSETESGSTSTTEITSTEIPSPTLSESEFDKLEREYNVMKEYMERTLDRLRGDVASYKAMVSLRDSQNMERLKVLKNKLEKFPDNELAVLEVVLLEILRRGSRRTNLADALQGLVEIQESCARYDGKC